MLFLNQISKYLIRKQN
uniref:Uncharacterized protein n=1 Tax=Rhizophora mucronata TaxID=61149 RepID=A0A2P2PD23_RHIMU